MARTAVIRWVSDEQMFMLACVDHCREQELDFETNIRTLLASHTGHTRTWGANKEALRSLFGRAPQALAGYLSRGSAFRASNAEELAAISSHLATIRQSQTPAPAANIPAQSAAVADNQHDSPVDRNAAVTTLTSSRDLVDEVMEDAPEIVSSSVCRPPSTQAVTLQARGSS
jgi:hypothetical protein